MWVATGISIVSGLSSIAGGISGKKAAEKAGKRQAKIIEDTADENRRRRELDLGQQLGGITAAIGASNLQMSGSAKRYRNVFESNIRAEMAWDKQKARLEARAAIKGGASVGQSAMYGGIGSAATSFSSAFSTGFAAYAQMKAKGPKK